MFNAFKARLENADGEKSASRKKARHNDGKMKSDENNETSLVRTQQDEEAEDEEQQLCDLHFIANCQSCRAWDVADGNAAEGGGDGGGKGQVNDDDETDWMTHTLRFGKDMLGKDLNWKRNNQDADDLVVIDPRQKEKEVIGGRKRERERRRKMEGAREWDQRGR